MRMRIFIILFFGYIFCYSNGANTTSTIVKTVSRKSNDNRGKRTLSSYENIVAQRRSSFAEPRAYYASADTVYPTPPFAYQPTSYVPDYSNYITEFGHQHHQQPHYVEPPEPIIEIIIKENNETLPPITPQPYVQKKKKEQVQVFYVNYKKDKHTNKLHLDTPIPAITPYGNDHPSEPEEEIIHYPTVAQSPIHTTTLRTIIHPDSEQYHSNSGIHVTFGTEDKSQYGHQYQEHNEESVLQSVIALPNQNHHTQDTSRFHDTNNSEKQKFSQNSRSEFTGDSRNFGNNYLNTNYKGLYQSYNQNQKQHHHHNPSQHAQTYVSHTLQIPSTNPSQPFRQVHSHQYQTTHFGQQNNHQLLHHQQQQQSQKQHKQETQRQQNNNNKNQQIFSPSQHSVYPTKNSVRFPTQSPAKSNNANVQYQQVKPRLPQHKPIPIPLQSIQSEHNSLTQQQQQQHIFDRSPYRLQGHYILHQPSQSQYQSSQQQQLVNEPFEDQYRQKIPNLSQRPIPKQQHQVSSHQYYDKQNQQSNSSPIQSGIIQQSTTNLGSNHNAYNNGLFHLGNISSGDSELIKSVSKFEQHITETVNQQPFEHHLHHHQHHQQQQLNGAHRGSNEFSASGNNVIHNIPAPQLGPTTPNPTFDYSSTNYDQYDYNTSPNPQYSLYVTQPKHSNLSPSDSSQQHVSTTQSSLQQYSIPSSSPSSSQYNDEVNPHIQIVTPVSSSDNIRYSNQNKYNNFQSGQPQIILNSQSNQLQSQKNYHPGHSVSTIHTEALQELEDRRQKIFGNDHNNEPQNYVKISSQNKYQHSGQDQQQYKHQDQQHQRNQYHLQQQQQQHQQQQQQSQQQQQQYRENNQNNNSNQTTQSNRSATTKSPEYKNTAQLPDEVPEELRQQLLSSGILENADISVLDYDKIGDTALENLPPEHLEHFYGNGGAAQISGSNKILTVVKPNGDKIPSRIDEKSNQIVGEKLRQNHSLPKKQNVDLKIVRFDSTNQKSVTDKYIKHDSTYLPVINISDRQYNRYLPLKISGTQFPIPDIAELNGKKISSVVVLAPVDTLQSIESDTPSSPITNLDNRQERDILDSKQIKFIAGDTLKQLLKKPTQENFKKWLNKEAQMEIDLQSVVLLVSKNGNGEQEIFMYDISTQAVNKLNGALSSAFVSVAEENAGSDNLENANISDSGIVERMSSTLAATPTTQTHKRKRGNNVSQSPSSIKLRENVHKPSSVTT